MSSYNGRKVTFGVLHYPIFVPNVGQFGPTLTAEHSASSKGCNMVVNDSCVDLTILDKNKTPVTITVPMTSFTHFVLAP